MDGRQFDEMTRTFASEASRRRVLQRLALGAAGALGAAFGLRRAGVQAGELAGCAGYGRVCSGSRCCTTPGAECRCYPNGHCRCVCPTGSSFAGGACVFPTTTTSTTTSTTTTGTTSLPPPP